MLTKFDLHRAIHTSNPTELFSCVYCISHKSNYINPFEKFTSKLSNGKSVTWDYRKSFHYDSENVLYILICNKCDYFYLGRSVDFKQRIRKHNSDIKHPQNSKYRDCAKQLK